MGVKKAAQGRKSLLHGPNVSRDGSRYPMDTEVQIASAVVLQRAVQYAGTAGIAHPDSYCAERAVVAPPGR
jgi:hypothetical protein